MTLAADILSDLPAFFEDWDDITWRGTTFKGIFHNEYEAVTLFAGQIESANPYAEALDTDIVGIAHGDIMTINAVAYKVTEIKPDGTGITVLILSKD